MTNSVSFRELRHRDKTFHLGADDLFYKSIIDHYNPTSELADALNSVIRRGQHDAWRTHRAGVWTHVFQIDDKMEMPPLPNQGWKVHISATNSNCLGILEEVAQIAFDMKIQFKYANDTSTLIMMTSKRWTRGGSGKFITLYPASESVFKDLLERLHGRLDRYSGSYILSDRRYRDSKCIYYRYGGFVSNTRVNVMGVQEEMLSDPDGQHVRDRRNPYFETPAWVTDPFPDDHSDDEGELSLKGGRYTIEKALSFSNTGGVYAAIDSTTGRKVVIKEARPHVELAADGSDAVARLIDEERILRSLGGLNIVPEVYDSFDDWENHYLVIEYLDATSLRETMLTSSPLLFVRPTMEMSQAYYGKYIKVFQSLLDSICELHRRGLVIGDISPVNIMVEKESQRVRLIDFEGAFYVATDNAKNLHTPGFRQRQDATKETNHFAADRYALGTIMLYCMFPFSAVSFLRSDLYTNVLPIILADIGWNDTPLLEIIRGLVEDKMTLEEASARLVPDITVSAPLRDLRRPMIGLHSSLPLGAVEEVLWDFLAANYRTGSEQALFPIDPFGVETNSLGFGFGAAGIAYALRNAGRNLPDLAEQRYLEELKKKDLTKLAPGLLVGTAGMAWERLAAGDVDMGLRLLQSTNESPLRHSHHSLFLGIAGIGMTNLAAYQATGAVEHLAVARSYGQTLKQTGTQTARGVCWTDDGATRIGYGYGQSGVALFLLRLSQATCEPQWRELGQQALDYDLSWAGQVEDGIKTFPAATDIEHTFEPYIEEGTSGIAKVAIRYGMQEVATDLLLDAYRKYSGFSGLLYGLAGFVDVLVDAYRYFGERSFLEMAERPLEGLVDLYLFESKKGHAVPGDGLFRVSTDYATGVAGVAHAIHRRIGLSGDDLCLDKMDVGPSPA